MEPPLPAKMSLSAPDWQGEADERGDRGLSGGADTPLNRSVLGRPAALIA